MAENGNSNVAGNRNVTPVPDPTLLTTQQLVREIAALSAQLTAIIEGVAKHADRVQVQVDRLPGMIDEKIGQLKMINEEKFRSIATQFSERDERSSQASRDNKLAVDAALAAAKEAIAEQNKSALSLPSLIDEKVNHLKTLHDEKFHSIATQFSERDTRTEQTSRDSKVAVDAALQAAKEAVGEQNKSSALAIAKSETSTTKQIDQMGVLIQNSTGGLNDKIDDIKSRLTMIEGKGFGGKETSASVSNIASLAMAGLAIVVAFATILFENHQAAVVPVLPVQPSVIAPK